MSLLKSVAQTLFRPFATVARSYNAAAERSPFTTGVVTTVIKTSAADLLAQKVIEGREEIDWKRQAMFVTFGGFYLGGFQYYLYNNVFTRICAPITATVGHRGVAPVKTFLDQCVHHPILYFPTYYALKGAIQGEDLSYSMHKCQDELWENCKSLWSIWIPAQIFNFAYVPRHLRIPFVAGTSMLWTVVLSVKRGALDKEDEENADIRPAIGTIEAIDEVAPAPNKAST